MLNMRNYGRGRPKTPTQRGVAISDDGGKTFAATYHDPALIEPACQASILRYSFTTKGKGQILFANPASESQRIKLTVRMSNDDGATWPTTREVYAGKSGYSSLTKLNDGSIGLLYEAGGDHPYERTVFARFTQDWLNGL
jgi:sialidase-1